MTEFRSYDKFISIVSMSSIPYMFTVNGDFVFDDSEAIVKNYDVMSDSWTEPFYHDFWGTNITSDLSHKSYRPLTILTFRLNYILNFNNLSAIQFKITNLIYHVICCLLVWQAIEKIIARVKYKSGGGYSIDIAYTTALLFSSHPVHTEAVCGIVGRADVLAAITFFLAFLCYDKCMDQAIYMQATIVMAGISMLFKENGITVLGFCIAYDIIVNFKKKKGKYHICTKTIGRVIYIGCGILLLVYTRWHIMGGKNPIFKPTDNPAAFSDDTFTKVATNSYLYFLNILLFIWPQWLCYDWSMGCVPLIKSIKDYRVIWAFSIYPLGMLFVYFVLVDKSKKIKRMLLIAIALIIIPFVPATNIFFPVGFVIAERILYISSVGYCFIICISLNKIVRVDRIRMVGLLSFCALLVLYDTRTWLRSKEWQNEFKLFLSGLSVCPENAKVHYNIAKVADAKNMTDWAMYEYREAIRLYPEYYQAMNNLANLLKNEKKFDEAEVYLKSAIHYKHDFPAAWMNLGIVYAHTMRYEESLAAYKSALSFRSNYPDCHYNIGNLYLEMNNSDLAIKHWTTAINLRPTHAPAWTNLLSLLDNTGQRNKTLQIIPNALKELPNSASINFIVANIYGKMDMYEEAEKYFLHAILLFGTRVQAVHYSNLGVLYHRWKKYDLAEKQYRKALKIDPNFQSLTRNLEKLEKLKKKV